MAKSKKKHSQYTILGFKAIQRAAAKVAENARKNNYKIPVWINGRIEYQIPEIITEQRLEDRRAISCSFSAT